MGTLFTQLRTNIRKVAITALSEYPSIANVTIFSNSNGAEPAESYVVINILEIRQIGQHNTSSKLDSQNRQAVQVAYEVMVQFSFIGSQSGDMSHSFNQRINNNYLVFESLKLNKLGIMRKSNVRRAPQKRDTKWVEYHNMDVTFSYIAVTQDVVDLIEAVVVEDVTADTIFRVPEGPIPV
jgi:hypothetical protein